MALSALYTDFVTFSVNSGHCRSIDDSGRHAGDTLKYESIAGSIPARQLARDVDKENRVLF